MAAALQDAVTAVYHWAGDIAMACPWMRCLWDVQEPFGFPDILCQLGHKGFGDIP
jgi:hypothetical protein